MAFWLRDSPSRLPPRHPLHLFNYFILHLYQLVNFLLLLFIVRLPLSDPLADHLIADQNPIISCNTFRGLHGPLLILRLDQRLLKLLFGHPIMHNETCEGRLALMIKVASKLVESWLLQILGVGKLWEIWGILF